MRALRLDSRDSDRLGMHCMGETALFRRNPPWSFAAAVRVTRAVKVAPALPLCAECTQRTRRLGRWKGGPLGADEAQLHGEGLL